jgi:hypothetical protein
MMMFDKTFHATHPDMMEGVTNDELRDRYLVEGLFAAGQVKLVYSHNERFGHQLHWHCLDAAKRLSAAVSLSAGPLEQHRRAIELHLRDLES